MKTKNTKLVMKFKTKTNGQSAISVDNPRMDLDSICVKRTMEHIIKNKLFVDTKYQPYDAVKKASVIETQMYTMFASKQER